MTQRSLLSRRLQKANTPALRRLGIVCPVMNMGGVERWAATLLRYIEGVEVTGLIATDHGRFSRVMSRAAPLWKTEDLDKFMTACDDIIVWTWERSCLQRLREYKGRLILVSHGASIGEWSRGICRTMAEELPEAELVGVSECASKCWTFPGQTRHSTTIYNGVELDRCSPVSPRNIVRRHLGLPPSAKVALMFSRNAPEKRPQMFLDAVGKLQRHGWYGIFCGQSDLCVSSKLNPPPNVKMLAAVNNPGDLFAAADVLSIHSEQESFGLSLVEAWAARLPTVACRWPVIDEFEQLGGGSVCEVLPIKIGVDDLVRSFNKAVTQSSAVTDRAYKLAFGPFSARSFASRWACYLNAPDALDFPAQATHPKAWASPYSY